MTNRFAARRGGNHDHVMRRVLGLFVAALVAVTFGAPMLPAGAQENSAEAINTKDGKSVFKLAFQVKKTMDSDVNASNSAVAFASCEDCKTVAAAIQVVLVADEPTSVDAENVAVALNYQCTECDTLAAAFQFVFGTGEEMKFTPEGKQQLNKLKQQFKDLKHRDDLTLAQLSREIAVIAGEVVKVVDTELVAKDKAEPATTSSSTTSTSTTSTTADETPSTTSAEATTTTSP